MVYSVRVGGRCGAWCTVCVWVVGMGHGVQCADRALTCLIKALGAN